MAGGCDAGCIALGTVGRIQKILTCLGEPPKPPPLAPARRPSPVPLRRNSKLGNTSWPGIRSTKFDSATAGTWAGTLLPRLEVNLSPCVWFGRGWVPWVRSGRATGAETAVMLGNAVEQTGCRGTSDAAFRTPQKGYDGAWFSTRSCCATAASREPSQTTLVSLMRREDASLRFICRSLLLISHFFG